MMEPKVRLKPVGKRPKTCGGRFLLLLACSFLFLRGVNSKTDIVGREALSRFTGETPPVPVHGLAAHPRIFEATDGMAPDVGIAAVQPEATTGKTKEESAATTASGFRSVSAASAERNVSRSHKFPESATAAAHDRLETSPEFHTLESESVSTQSPRLAESRKLSESVSTQSPELSESRRLSESVSTQAPMPSSTAEPSESGAETLVAATPVPNLGGEAASAVRSAVIVVSGSMAEEVLRTEAWHDKRDTFWSIGPTASGRPRPDVRPTSSTPNERDVRSEVDRFLIVPTAASDFGGVRQATTVSYLGLSTDRWSDEEVPPQPSSDSQVRKEEFGLPAGTVAGIVVASIGFVAIVAAVLGLFVFRRFRGIGAKSYDNKYNGDNCSYLDSLQVSYINNHIELPKESSEEMFSLDNDSFLNSLEAMTMENYWAEDRRSTRV